MVFKTGADPKACRRLRAHLASLYRDGVDVVAAPGDHWTVLDKRHSDELASALRLAPLESESSVMIVPETHRAYGRIAIGPDFIQDPFPLLSRLREAGPVHEVVFEKDFAPCRWLITRYKGREGRV